MEDKLEDDIGSLESTDSSASDALQTDVMRLLALFAFVLLGMMMQSQELKVVQQRVKEMPIPMQAKSESKSKKEGYSLAFQSADAFDHLLIEGAIVVYLELDSMYHRLSRSGQEYQLSVSEAAGLLFPMDSAELPRGIGRLATTGDYDGGRWWVSLPKTLHEEIVQIVSSQNSADMVISGRGRLVVIKPGEL